MSNNGNETSHENNNLPATGDALPPWVVKMRQAAQSVIQPSDIEAIVRKQVDKAKEGDPAALKFVFEQVLGGAALKGATFVQNNFTSESRPDKPTPARPRSGEKIDVMSRRAAAGLPLNQLGDGPKDSEG